MSEYLHRGNKLWEGSRMFLPEHKQAILERKRRQQKREKPELDEQQLEKMNEMIQLSRQKKLPVSVRCFEAGAFRKVTGIVLDFRPFEQEVRMLDETGGHILLKTAGIIDVSRV
ncbi:YolD-like family protein [Heyndrickxia acidiproducens]|uniref:YolD-like family protein n=1 Tax=Heyndrickxia acidiproducens TaxID=1121084 RepID=UPI00037FDDDE|nr:YolD-like family protein [Heyndrickxia acidiproducens]